MRTTRLLALAGCVLLAAACAQENATAPPGATATDVTAAVLPSTFGGEYGTITLTKDRSDTNFCVVKVSLKGLYNEPTTGDGYWLLLAEPGGVAEWMYEISDDMISARGTYTYQFSLHVDKMQTPFSLRYLNEEMGTGWYKIADFGATPLMSYHNFKATNRCF